jgi:hypothetical protein
MCPRYGAEQFPADAAFVTHAREDVPWLLDALDAAEARADKLRRALERERSQHVRKLGQTGVANCRRCPGEGWPCFASLRLDEALADV